MPYSGQHIGGQVKSLILLALTALPCAYANAADSATPWTDRISFSGDLRVRHDWEKKGKEIDESDRHRERYRARLAVKGTVNDKISAKVRLASSDAANPVSNNSTFTDNSSKKSVYFDAAAIEWKVCEGADVTVGKQDNTLRPIKRSELIFDGDYTPEGISINGNKEIFTRLAAFSIQERAPDASGHSEPDTGLMSAMAGINKDMGSMTLLAGLGYHDFTNLKKNTALAGGFLNNTNDGTHYVHDYKVGEALAEAKWKLGGASLSVYADYIMNFGAEEKNEGILVGSEYQILDDGKPLWIFSYTYQSNGKDSTVSAINHSDVNNGNDSGFAHIVTVGRTVAPNTMANLTYYHGQVVNNDATKGDIGPFWIDRGQADLMVSF